MSATASSGLPQATLCPLSLQVDELACMLNLELADHPVDDGVAPQWFDDEAHGTGMLAFLSRRADRKVAPAPQPPRPRAVAQRPTPSRAVTLVSPVPRGRPAVARGDRGRDGDPYAGNPAEVARPSLRHDVGDALDPEVTSPRR